VVEVLVPSVTLVAAVQVVIELAPWLLPMLRPTQLLLEQELQL
jgi:hypothetical protein